MAWNHWPQKHSEQGNTNSRVIAVAPVPVSDHASPPASHLASPAVVLPCCFPELPHRFSQHCAPRPVPASGHGGQDSGQHYIRGGEHRPQPFPTANGQSDWGQPEWGVFVLSQAPQVVAHWMQRVGFMHACCSGWLQPRVRPLPSLTSHCCCNCCFQVSAMVHVVQMGGFGLVKEWIALLIIGLVLIALALEVRRGSANSRAASWALLAAKYCDS